MTSALFDTVRTYSLFVVTPRSDDEFRERALFVEKVLDVVARIPPGKVMSYGDIAEYLGEGGPRQVAKVMSTYGSEVPWHRVLRSNGTCAEQIAVRQLKLLQKERVALDPTGTRVRMSVSRWDGRTVARRRADDSTSPTAAG
jgi:alkylated DNA nucleotide flippase Atl1